MNTYFLALFLLLLPPFLLPSTFSLSPYPSLLPSHTHHPPWRLMDTYFLPPYHWWELPQVSFLSHQKLCRDKDFFVATKHVFCREKSVCRDKSFVAKKLCLSRQNIFVSDNYLLYLLFVISDNLLFVAAKVSSRQICQDKSFVATNLSGQKFRRDKHNFVATI